MWTVATLSTPTEQMPLSETFERLPRCRFRVDESAFGSNDQVLSVWFREVDRDELEAALDADASVENRSHLATEGEELFYEVVLADAALVPMHVLQEYDATVEEAYGDGEEWSLKVRFSDRDALSAVAEKFDDLGLSMDYHSITSGSDGSRKDQLTENQREVLETALEEGYYQIPRDVTLEELAEELDVTHQSLSESLRRAQETLAESSVDSKMDPEGSSGTG